MIADHGERAIPKPSLPVAHPVSEHRIQVGEPVNIDVGSLLSGPEPADRLLVLGHGAGAGMRHPFLERLTAGLAQRGTTTLRYQFPYKERGSKRPDRHPALFATVSAAVAHARSLTDAPIWAGGKSMGGRMTSLTAAQDGLPGVQGLVFVGFPLHAPGKQGDERADHLDDVDLPMLFLQGTRDTLAELSRIERVCARLGERATLQVIDGADHGFHVRKSSGRTDAQVQDELADDIDAWLTGQEARSA